MKIENIFVLPADRENERLVVLKTDLPCGIFPYEDDVVKLSFIVEKKRLDSYLKLHFPNIPIEEIYIS